MHIRDLYFDSRPITICTLHTVGSRVKVPHKVAAIFNKDHKVHKEADILREGSPPTMSGVTCQVSCITCHISGVRCQVSGVRCHNRDKEVELVLGRFVFNGAYPVSLTDSV